MKRAGRILVVTDAYPPTIGGADRATQLLARGLAERGREVAVVTSWQRDLPQVEQEGAVTVHRVRDASSRVPYVSDDPYKHVPPPVADPEAAVRMRRIVADFAPDVVHAYGWITYSCLAALSRSPTPVLLSARDYAHVCAKRTLERGGVPCDGPVLRQCLSCAASHYGRAKGAVAVAGVMATRRTLAGRISGLHCNSTWTREVMERHLPAMRGIPVVEVIPSFREDRAGAVVDAAILSQLPEEPYLLFVGALREVKGVYELLEAYQRLDHAPPLVLIGTKAPDSPESYPPGVTVLHDVPHATVMAAWDRALFGVFPSRWPEPLGNVVHEAMSRGRAVIGTSPGGHRDMIEDGVNGLLVPAGDPGALTAAMERLLGDPELRGGMGRRGRELAKGFTLSAVLPRFEKLYDRVAAVSRP